MRENVSWVFFIGNVFVFWGSGCRFIIFVVGGCVIFVDIEIIGIGIFVGIGIVWGFGYIWFNFLVIVINNG